MQRRLFRLTSHHCTGRVATAWNAKSQGGLSGDRIQSRTNRISIRSVERGGGQTGIEEGLGSRPVQMGAMERELLHEKRLELHERV